MNQFFCWQQFCPNHMTSHDTSQLKILLELRLIIWVIERIPKKERSKSVHKRKWPPLFYAQVALTWIHTVSIPKPPIKPYPIAHGSILSIDHSTAILSPGPMLQSELQASHPNESGLSSHHGENRVKSTILWYGRAICQVHFQVTKVHLCPTWQVGWAW